LPASHALRREKEELAKRKKGKGGGSKVQILRALTNCFQGKEKKKHGWKRGKEKKEDRAGLGVHWPALPMPRGGRKTKKGKKAKPTEIDAFVLKF